MLHKILLRLAAWVLITATLLKLCADYTSMEVWPDGVNFDPVAWILHSVEGHQEASVHDDHFDLELDTTVRTRRCDACRIISGRFDVAFDLAEANVGVGFGTGRELSDQQVETVARAVCSKETFSEVVPIRWRDRKRLAGRGIETWAALRKKPGLATASPSAAADAELDWPLRVRNRCRYLRDHMGGAIVYDMWMRTSANSPEDFEVFVCYGQGVFGDCRNDDNTDDGWADDIDDEVDGEEPNATRDDYLMRGFREEVQRSSASSGAARL